MVDSIEFTSTTMIMKNMNLVTLDLFTARSNLLPGTFIKKKMPDHKLSLKLEDFGLNLEYAILSVNS